MNIGVVIPTYNRRDNLLIAISALARQTYRDFYLVIADDGSTDGTAEAVAALMETPTWQGRLIWAGFVPERDIRPCYSHNRNKGVDHLPAECSLICFVDSDVVLNPEALGYYAQAHAAQPDALIVGLVDWLPPLPLEEVKQLVDNGQIEQLRHLVPADITERVQGTFVGREPRKAVALSARFTDDLSWVRTVDAKLFWSANIGCPLTVWQQLGGFDESMNGYGAEDIEFGYKAQKQGISCLYSSPIWALHVWHPKANFEAALANNHNNLGYIAQKHGLQAYIGSMARTSESVTTKLNSQQPGRQLSDEQKMALALKLRQKQQR